MKEVSGVSSNQTAFEHAHLIGLECLVGFAVAEGTDLVGEGLFAIGSVAGDGYIGGQVTIFLIYNRGHLRREGKQSVKEKRRKKKKGTHREADFEKARECEHMSTINGGHRELERPRSRRQGEEES